MKTEQVSGRKKNLWQKLLNPNRLQDLEHSAIASADSLATAQDSISPILANLKVNVGGSLEAHLSDSQSGSQSSSQSNNPIDTPDNNTGHSLATGSELQSELQIGQFSHRVSSLSWFEQSSFHLQQAVVSCSSGDWQDANTACQTVLEQLEPEAAKAYFILGRSLQAQQQFADAEQAYQKALSLQPAAETHARLASLYADQQRFADAIQQYQAAIQLQPEFAGAHWKLAQVWQQLGEESNAAVCYYQALRLQPTWATATDYCRLADQLLKFNQFTAAQACYRSALRLQPDLAAAQIGMGDVLRHQGQQPAALDYYQQALNQGSIDQALCIRLGHAFVQLEQWQAALACYQQVLQLTPDWLEAIAGLQQCYRQLEQWQDALHYSRRLVQLQPDAFEHWQHLADMLSQMQQWSAAVDAYQQAIVRRPSCAQAHYHLGHALLQLQRWQDAAAVFQTSLALHPNSETYYQLGAAYTHLQDWDRAIEAYRMVLKLEPEFDDALERLADMLQRRARIDETDALNYYQQAIQQNPLEPENYHRALELQPDAVELYLGLLDALVAAHRLDEAFICCQMAAQVHPGHAEVIAKQQQILEQRERFWQQVDEDRSTEYERWLQQHNPSAEDLAQMAKTAATFAYQPRISILMPVYNPPIRYLRAAIQSVLDQVYPHWELCIADDDSNPNVRATLNEYAAQDPRIKLFFRQENGHISAASNSALALATGDYIALFDHDDQLAPEALYEVVALLNQHPEADMIYSDEDKLNEQDQRIQPFFKPDWCPDSFLSRMYTCHLGIYRRRLVERIGGFRIGYEGSQDYDLVLRLTEQTQQIFHLPKVLYHWRMHATSTASGQTIKSYAEEAAKRAIFDACQRRGEPAAAVNVNPEFPSVYLVRYQIVEHKPVSIIIPTRNLGAVLDRCLNSLFQKSSYPNYEVILIDNGSDETETFKIIESWQQQEPERFKCYPLNIPFNYSRINNSAVARTKGDYLLFLNNDVEIITPDWIEAMVEQAQRQSIGAVGARLLYPDQTIQHAGVVLGIGGVAGHSHKYFQAQQAGYFSQIASINNYSAVTAACMMCRREVFVQAGGFDESLAVAFNDVDLCLKIGQLGYRNIYLPHVMLYHHESKSRGIENTLEKQQRFRQEVETMQRKWGNLLQADPCYSPHLTNQKEDYGLRL